MNNQRYYNHTPIPLKPRLTDNGHVNLCQVDGVGWDEPADSTTVITRSFVVRVKDVPRILGERNSMLMNISEVSGASLSLSVDMTNVLNRTVQINVWGRREEVDDAEARIFNLITEGYDDPPVFLPMLHGYVHQDVMVLPINKALHLLRKNNLVTLEAENFTWIDVDASKAWKTGAAVEVDIHIGIYLVLVGGTLMQLLIVLTGFLLGLNPPVRLRRTCVLEGIYVRVQKSGANLSGIGSRIRSGLPATG